MSVRFYEKLGRWRWAILTGNNTTICRSGTAFKTRRSCERSFWNFAVDMQGDPSLFKVRR